MFLWQVYVLSRASALEMLSQVFAANVAVKGCFVISGYLVMMSREKSSSLGDYGAKRVRRIYPAYAAVVSACALAGMFLMRLLLARYGDFSHGGYIIDFAMVQTLVAGGLFAGIVEPFEQR